VSEFDVPIRGGGNREPSKQGWALELTHQPTVRNCATHRPFPACSQDKMPSHGIVGAVSLFFGRMEAPEDGSVTR
jgi:hypothetical protein